MMKILLLIDALDVGGAETHVITLAVALAERGHEVTVLSAGGALERGLARAGVAALRFPSPVRGRRSVPGFRRNLRFLWRLVRERRFDVLHAHTRRTALLLRLIGLLDRFRPPFVRRGAPYRHAAMRRLISPAAVVTAHAKFASRHRQLSFWGDATIAVSEDLRDHTAATFGVSPERIRVIPNGIDTTRFRPPDDAKRDASALRVTFASRLDDDCSAVAYALLTLVPRWRALASERGLTLTVTLIGGGSQAETIARLAAAESGVEACGACARMEEKLREADVFIGVSRAALEAAFSGCAVILAGDEGAGGLLTEQTLDRWATENFCCRSRRDAPLDEVLTEAFVSFLDRTPSQRHALVAGVRARLLERYGAERMADDTVALYREVLTRRRRLTVVVGGYAGCGNLGDDAILRALCDRWQGKAAPRSLCGVAPPLGAEYASLRVEALTGSRARFDLPCHDRRRPLAALRRADAFVLGGGALLQNCSAHGNRSLAYYLALALLSRLVGCPWYIVAGGVGPIKGPLARALTAVVVGTARGISVRDAPSRALLCSLGLPARRIRSERDPVCSLTPTGPDQARALLRRLAITAAPDTLVCVAPHGRMRDTDRLTAELARLRREGAFPLFFAFDQGEDTLLCHRLQAACGGMVFPMTSLEDKDKPEAWIASVFALSRRVMAGRLHALIMASPSGVEATPLDSGSDDPKLTAFAATATHKVGGLGQNSKKRAKEPS